MCRRSRTAPWVGAVAVVAAVLATGAAVAGEGSKKGDKPTLPYMDPNRGREGHPLSDRKVNQYRVYDFYSRQAEYYMGREEVPEVLPPTPAWRAVASATGASTARTTSAAIAGTRWSWARWSEVSSATGASRR